MTYPKLLGHTIARIAREAGVRWSSVERFARGQMISGFAEYRIKSTLVRLGAAGTRRPS